MSPASVAGQQFDAYKNFKYRVRWEGRLVAGMSNVSVPERSTASMGHREHVEPSRMRKSPGRTKFDAITLERGVTHDADFEKWANEVSNGGSTPASVSTSVVRKDLNIEVYNETGKLALAYRVYRCWISTYQGLPDPDGNAGAVAIQLMKVENDGWERA